MRFVDIRAEAVSALGQEHVHSVGPILLTSGTFIRPLPGVYALPDQLPDLSKIAFDPPAFLLNEEQAKLLAMARFAGEPFGSYSLWQPEVEYALCRWGETKANPVLWQSQLAMASIDAWPVSEREREHWRDLQRRQGRYHLQAAIRYPIKQLWPPLHRLLAALHLVQTRGSINWIVANRLLKRRIDAHASPALLGILCLLGVVTPPSHWQKPHEVKNADHNLTKLLSAELQRTGILSWDSDVGVDVVNRLTSQSTLPPGAWLNPELASELRTVAADDSVDVLSLPTDGDDDAASFKSLLEEVARQQRMAAIQENIRDVTQTDDA